MRFACYFVLEGNSSLCADRQSWSRHHSFWDWQTHVRRFRGPGNRGTEREADGCGEGIQGGQFRGGSAEAHYYPVELASGYGQR